MTVIFIGYQTNWMSEENDISRDPTDIWFDADGMHIQFYSVLNGCLVMLDFVSLEG